MLYPCDGLTIVNENNLLTVFMFEKMFKSRYLIQLVMAQMLWEGSYKTRLFNISNVARPCGPRTYIPWLHLPWQIPVPEKSSSIAPSSASFLCDIF